MKWYIRNGKDDKSQEEEITHTNKNSKQVEILNRVRSYLNTYDGDELPTKEEINQGMLNELNHISKEK